MTDPSVYAKTLALPAGFDAPRLLRYDDVPGASSGNRLGRAAPEVQMLKRGRSAGRGRSNIREREAVLAGAVDARSPRYSRTVAGTARQQRVLESASACGWRETCPRGSWCATSALASSSSSWQSLSVPRSNRSSRGRRRTGMTRTHCRTRSWACSHWEARCSSRPSRRSPRGRYVSSARSSRQQWSSCGGCTPPATGPRRRWCSSGVVGRRPSRRSSGRVRSSPRRQRPPPLIQLLSREPAVADATKRDYRARIPDGDRPVQR
jgi:hypothetical protein